jgi:hypothetical protein
MITVSRKNAHAQLVADLRIRGLAQCGAPRHEFSDLHPNPAKRLRAGSLWCIHCHVIVPIIAAYLYEVGISHGEKPLAGPRDHT